MGTAPKVIKRIECDPLSPARARSCSQEPQSTPFIAVYRPKMIGFVLQSNFDRVRGFGGGDDPATTGRFSRDGRAD